MVDSSSSRAMRSHRRANSISTRRCCGSLASQARSAAWSWASAPASRRAIQATAASRTLWCCSREDLWKGMILLISLFPGSPGFFRLAAVARTRQIALVDHEVCRQQQPARDMLLHGFLADLQLCCDFLLAQAKDLAHDEDLAA